MSKQLTPQQIDNLFHFCDSHGVKYYDVQIELVDHLASTIEQKWEENPTLSYENARGAIFDQFGVSGLKKIMKAKEKELRKKYIRLLWKYVGEYFKLPKIILTIAITLILFSILRIFENNLETCLLLLFTYLLLFFVLEVKNKERYKINLVHGKPFLLYDYLKSIKPYFSIFFSIPTSLLPLYGIYLQRSNSYLSHNLYIEFFTTFFITLFSIFLFAMSFYIPKRVKEDFIREYPQFVKS
jgi:hypothetical protein